jgi:hypothetical protein
MLDFTKRRKGSIAENGRKIAVCPKCGRKGTISRHRDGSGICVHKAEDQGFCLCVREYCSLPKPAEPEVPPCDEPEYVAREASV